jgi:hypothetical protein
VRIAIIIEPSHPAESAGLQEGTARGENPGIYKPLSRDPSVRKHNKKKRRGGRGMNAATCKNRVERCAQLMKKAGFDLPNLTQPPNMSYLAGDGRFCACVLISKEGKVALGMPKTELDDVKRSARFDFVGGFEDEVGMIHSIHKA